MPRTSAAWMPRTTVLAGAGLTVAMIAVGLTASAAAAAPIGPASAAPSVGCIWLPPFPTATSTDPIGQPLYPCGPE